jgi:hypothetical protein
VRAFSVLKFDSIEGLLLTLGVALLPVYIFSSGGIQPTHMILAMFAMVTLLRKGIPAEIWVVFLAAISFYSFFVESFYTIAGGNPASLMSSLFFCYNFFLVTAIYTYCRRCGLSALVPGVIVACVIAILAVSVTGVSLQESGQGRATGTFNNPNQLGYFSVCILSLTYLFYRHGHLKYIVAVGMFLVTMFLSVASLSKAAMIANFMVVFLALKPAKSESSANNKILSISIAFFWLSLVVFGATAIFVFYFQGAFDEYLFVQRLQGIAQENDSSLESRGYFAFLEGNAIQILFGLGAGEVAEIVGHEVHSTLASVLNNNGIAGFLLFSGALVVWALNLWRAYGFIGMCCLTGPAMLYGITHNGTRFTAFWVLFGASMSMAYRITKERNEVKAQRGRLRKPVVSDAF